MTETNIEKKFPLSRKEEQDLRLWFFIVHPGKPYIRNEGVLAIVGYDLESARIKAGIESEGHPATYTGQSSIVKDFISKLYLDIVTIPSKEPKKEPKPKPLSKEMTKEKFRASLLLTLNEPKKWGLKINKKDKKALKEIIEKL